MDTAKNKQPIPDDQERAEAGSAPELPHEVAKQFGLHHSAGGSPSKAAPSVSEAAEDSPSSAAVPAETTALMVIDTPPPVPDADDDTAEDETDETKVINDPKTDAAVEDIVTKEGDELLALHDHTLPAEPAVPKRRRGFWGSIGHFFKAWWRNKWARYITLLLLVSALVAVAVVPRTRYAALNTLGVRSSASVTVLDDTTQLPLKNVSVALGDVQTQTGRDGVAHFAKLKLGNYKLTIKRIGFAPIQQTITIGWGSNPLAAYKLQATGLQYTLTIKDFLSGKPIANAEATSSDLNALSDAAGKIVLTVDNTDITQLSVTVTAAGYRSETITLNANQSTTATVNLVSAKKEVFLSNQSGKYDVYTIDLDGQNRKVILAGTGNENATNLLVVSPDGSEAALVSSRDAIRDPDGFMLQSLTLINLTTGISTTVDHAEQIQPVDWQGNRLVYRLVVAGASAANSQRNRLVAYDYTTNAKVQLATANQFNAVIAAAGYLYYAPSSTDPTATLGLFRVKADGSGRQTITSSEVWTGIRTDYNTLYAQTPNGWYTYTFTNGKFASAQPPANPVNVYFADNTSGTQSVRTDSRDGKGILLLHDIGKNTDATLASQPGLTQPVRWIGDQAVIYRVVTNSETADYLVSASGTAPRKITDVTSTGGYATSY